MCVFTFVAGQACRSDLKLYPRVGLVYSNKDQVVGMIVVHLLAALGVSRIGRANQWDLRCSVMSSLTLKIFLALNTVGFRKVASEVDGNTSWMASRFGSLRGYL